MYWFWSTPGLGSLSILGLVLFALACSHPAHLLSSSSYFIPQGFLLPILQFLSTLVTFPPPNKRCLS